MPESAHIKTITDLAKAAGVTRATVYVWMKRADFPKKGRYGWSRRAFREYSKKALARAKASQTGEHSDLKRVKLQRQIDKIDRDIRDADFDHERKAGLHIPTDEYHAELDEIVAIVRGGLEQWVQWVDAEHRDPDISKRARSIRDKALTTLSDKCGRAGK